MSDVDSSEPNAETDDAAETTEPDDEQGEKAESAKESPEVERLLAALRKRNTEAKQLKDKLAKNDTEGSRKAEEAAEQLKAAEAERDQLVSALTRERVGRKLGLPPELCERLQGESEEEITEDAQRLSKLLEEQGKARLNTGQGARGKAEADPNEVFRRLARNAS